MYNRDKNLPSNMPTGKVFERPESPSMRIGIICTSLVEESIKDELLKCNNIKRPWLWLENLKANHTIMYKGKPYTSDDYAIGYFIKWAYKDVEIEFIDPRTMTLPQLHKNDLNLTIIFDRLESFHIDPHRYYDRFVSIMSRAKNIYPSFEYQSFINQKSVYYRYMKNRNIPIVPFFSVTYAQYKKDPEKMALSVLQKAKRQKWECIIAKPDYGQESKDFKRFHPEVTKERLLAYIERIFKVYPGIVFQKYVPGFDTGTVREFRTYFVGDKYRYTIITGSESDIARRPVEEGGRYKSRYFGRVKTLARKVVKTLPTIVVAGVEMDRFLTRVDIALLASGEVFVNEIEFAPSLYAPNTSVMIDRELGNHLVKLTAKFIAARKCQKKTCAFRTMKKRVGVKRVFKSKKTRALAR